MRKPTGSFVVNHFCIYRWASFASQLPPSHPISPLVWQRFFLLYLQRPRLEPGYSVCSVWCSVWCSVCLYVSLCNVRVYVCLFVFLCVRLRDACVRCACMLACSVPVISGVYVLYYSAVCGMQCMY